jgi:hypothetical protein
MVDVNDLPQLKNYLGRETTKEDVKRAWLILDKLQGKIKNWDGTAEIRKWRDLR